MGQKIQSGMILLSVFAWALCSVACNANGNAQPQQQAQTSVSSTSAAGGNQVVATPLSLSPETLTIVSNGTLQMYASGGTAPYEYRVISGGGSIGLATGYYTAPSTATSAYIRVTDAAGSSATAMVTVSTSTTLAPSALSLSAASRSIAARSALQLSASGGTTPYRYYIASGGGQIFESTGLYTAPSLATTVDLAVEDAAGARAFFTVSVTGSVTPLVITYTTSSLVTGGTRQFSATGGVAPYTFFVNSGGGSIDANTGFYTAPSSPSTIQVGVRDAMNTTVYSYSLSVGAAGVACAGNYTIYQNSRSYTWTGTMSITQYTNGTITGSMYFAGTGLGYGTTTISGYCYPNGTIAFTRNGPFGSMDGRSTYQTQNFNGNYSLNPSNSGQVIMNGSFSTPTETMSWYAVGR